MHPWVGISGVTLKCTIRNGTESNHCRADENYWAGRMRFEIASCYDKRIQQVLRLYKIIFLLINTRLEAFSYDLVSYALFQPVRREAQQRQDQHILADY